MSTVHALQPEPKPRRRVVVLAQDEAIRDLLVHWLEGEGEEVWAFSDGTSVAEWLEKGAAEVMFTDRVYPAWNGLGTIMTVKQLCPHMRLVVAGIGRDDPFQSFAHAIGCDAVLHSPLRKAAVMEALSR